MDMDMMAAAVIPHILLQEAESASALEDLR